MGENDSVKPSDYSIGSVVIGIKQKPLGLNTSYAPRDRLGGEGYHFQLPSPNIYKPNNFDDSCNS